MPLPVTFSVSVKTGEDSSKSLSSSLAPAAVMPASTTTPTLSSASSVIETMMMRLFTVLQTQTITTTKHNKCTHTHTTTEREMSNESVTRRIFLFCWLFSHRLLLLCACFARKIDLATHAHPLFLSPLSFSPLLPRSLPSLSSPLSFFLPSLSLPSPKCCGVPLFFCWRWRQLQPSPAAVMVQQRPRRVVAVARTAPRRSSSTHGSSLPHGVQHPRPAPAPFSWR